MQHDIFEYQEDLNMPADFTSNKQKSVYRKKINQVQARIFAYMKQSWQLFRILLPFV